MENAEGQEPTSEATTTQAEPDSVTSSPAPMEDVEALRTELDSYKKQLESVRQEAASKRVKAREAAEKAGEFERAKQLLEEELAEARKQLEALPELQQARQELEAIRKRREEQVSAKLAKIEDEELRDILASIPDIDKREAAADKHLTQPNGPNKPPPGATPAASSGPVEFTPGISQKDPAAWQRLREQEGLATTKARKPFFARK